MAKAKSGFNFRSLDTITACNKPVELEIRDIDGEPTGVFFSVLGQDSDLVRARMKALADEEIQAAAVGSEPDADVGSAERRMIELTAAATIGWRDGNGPAIDWDDERLDCSPDNARRVVSRLLPVRQQIAATLFDLSRFMKG